MSDFSLTLVLQIKTSKIINDMAKVSIKSEKITAFGGIFFVLDKFDRILSSVIDSHLGLRSKLIGYQYSEIIRAIFSVFCCGGDCMEDLNLYLKDVLAERPHTRVPSADTVLRGIEELATENISYTAEKTGNVYDFQLLTLERRKSVIQEVMRSLDVRPRQLSRVTGMNYETIRNIAKNCHENRHPYPGACPHGYSASPTDNISHWDRHLGTCPHGSPGSVTRCQARCDLRTHSALYLLTCACTFVFAAGGIEAVDNGEKEFVCR